MGFDLKAIKTVLQCISTFSGLHHPYFALYLLHPILQRKMSTRYVKLGRKPTRHWAVQVEDTWYEIDGDFLEKKGNGKLNRIATTHGKVAKSGAGRFGGDFVGKTTKSDAYIKYFCREWVSNNPTYNVFSENCQKFAIDLIR